MSTQPFAAVLASVTPVPLLDWPKTFTDVPHVVIPASWIPPLLVTCTAGAAVATALNRLPTDTTYGAQVNGAERGAAGVDGDADLAGPRTVAIPAACEPCIVTEPLA